MAAYQWKTGSYISAKKFDAQAAGEQFEELENSVGLTAENVVEANRPEDAVLHDAFEWDNDAAADEWRKHQARHLINAICIKVQDGSTGEEIKDVRAFFTVERKEPEYQRISKILANSDKTEALLATALGELRAFQKKYTLLTALQPVFDAIEKVTA